MIRAGPCQPIKRGRKVIDCAPTCVDKSGSAGIRVDLGWLHANQMPLATLDPGVVPLRKQKRIRYHDCLGGGFCSRPLRLTVFLSALCGKSVFSKYSQRPANFSLHCLREICPALRIPQVEDGPALATPLILRRPGRTGPPPARLLPCWNLKPAQ